MNLIFVDYVLIVLLIASVAFDLTQKRIPNFLTFPVILFGLIFYTATGLVNGLLFSLFGFLLGIGLFLIPFMLGGMGGGDVKLLGAIGALKGAEFVFIATLYTAFCGGIIAIIYMAYKGQLLVTLKKVLGIVAKPLLGLLAMRFRSPFFNQLAMFFTPPQEEEGEEKKELFFPYGVAIGVGTLIALVSFGNGFLPVGEMLFR